LQMKNMYTSLCVWIWRLSLWHQPFTHPVRSLTHVTQQIRGTKFYLCQPLIN